VEGKIRSYLLIVAVLIFLSPLAATGARIDAIFD